MERKFSNYSVIDSDSAKTRAEVSEFELALIKKYLNKIGLDADIAECKPLNTCFFYESYQIVIGEKRMILKINTDSENNRVTNEFAALNAVSDLVSPLVVDYTMDKDIGIEFLLTSMEKGLSFENYGVDDFVYNIGTFAAVLDTVHEAPHQDLPTLEKRLEENSSISDIEEFIDENEIKILEKLVQLNINDIEEIFKKIKNQVCLENSITVTCHSNTKPSNIIYNEGYIKLINFENAHQADIYYSLTKSYINNLLFYAAKSERLFLSEYHKHSRLLGDLTKEEFLQNYAAKKDNNKLLIFQELFAKILLHFFAYGAFNRKKELNRYMHIYEHLKPVVSKYLSEYEQSFDKLFYTTMPTVKTYDIEELKIIKEMSV